MLLVLLCLQFLRREPDHVKSDADNDVIGTLTSPSP